MTVKNVGGDMDEHLSNIDSAYTGNQSQSQINAIIAGENASNVFATDQRGLNEILPGMTPEEQTAYLRGQDPSNLIKDTSEVTDMTDAQFYPESLFTKIMGQIALMSTVGAATAGIGGALAPAVDAALGTTAGGLGAGVASGATYGAIGGTLNSALTGQNVGKGALIGGALGGLGGGIGYGLSNDGLSSFENSALAKTGMGAVKGAIDGQGALQGAEGGAISAGTGAVAGSILNNGSTIFSSGGAANPTSDPNLTTPAAPSNSMSDLNPYGYDSNGYDPSNPLGSMTGYTGGAPVSYDGGANLQGYGVDPSLGGNAPTSGYMPTDGSGNVLTSGGGGSSGNLLGSLASLLGGSNGGGLSPQLLSQLLGAGSSLIGGSLSSNAAKSAASTFQQEAMYNPYGTNTVNGSTSFQNGQLNSSLSPGAQQNVSGLNNLAQQNMSSLAGGTTASANNYFNQLQQQQKMGNSQYMGSNLDNQFANGIMSSTAGQYQTGAALNNVNNQSMQDMMQAQNFANTQQQNQLQQLTGSLNGLQGYNTQQLAAGTLGAQMGTGQSNANYNAGSPWLAANSGSNIGNFLTGQGSGMSNPFSSLGGY